MTAPAWLLRKRKRLTRSVVALAAVGLLGTVAWSSRRAPGQDEQAASVGPVAAPSAEGRRTESGPRRGHHEDEDDDDDRSYVFRIPSGEATALSCDEARAIVEQVRAGLAYTAATVPTMAFASSTSDWLDPHGLLSLAKDAPAPHAIARAAADLIADIEGRRSRSCAAAATPGAVLDGWSGELRRAFDEGRKAFVGVDGKSAATEPLPPTGLAREIARELGRRVGVFESLHPEAGTTFGDQARRRFFPDLGKEGWAKVVLAAAVRAYVPIVDPHGEWAPFDEESRIYELDLASRPPSRLWHRAVPTALGIRMNDGARAPLQEGDVVLSLANVSTAGLPLEQVDQLSFAEGDGHVPLRATVLRAGELTDVLLTPATPTAVLEEEVAGLPTERVPYGDGDVLVVAIKDVRDDLGEELLELLADEREKGARKLQGIVLDLRDNGGGSTDGALGALSLFLPGQALFAMRRRDGSVEVDRASIPREEDRWTGPVATFVDGTTASAAEMIAGALAAYHRGPTIGTTTFGKGCAQEYVDDDAHAGVLRLTTLVYALPDGSPVQRVGLQPQIRFPFPPSEDGGDDREAKLARSAPSWRGPDLRERALPIDDAPWPSSGGNLGPCQEADTCRALRLLGGGPKRPPLAKH